MWLVKHRIVFARIARVRVSALLGCQRGESGRRAVRHGAAKIEVIQTATAHPADGGHIGGVKIVVGVVRCGRLERSLREVHGAVDGQTQGHQTVEHGQQAASTSPSWTQHDRGGYCAYV